MENQKPAFDFPQIELRPEHREHLRRSGLNDPTIDAARIYSVIDPVGAARLLNWTGTSGPAPAIAFPVFGLHGDVVQTVLRPDNPRRRDNGSVAKYEQPVGDRHRIYFAPIVEPSRFLDVHEELFLTEGIKKALSLGQIGHCVLSMQGVSTWHDAAHRKETDEWRLHPDLAQIPLKGRRVYITFDGGDTTENPPVILAEARLARMLLDNGADVRLIRIPYVRGSSKVGIDDFLVRGAANAIDALTDEAIPADPLVRVQQVSEDFSNDRSHLAQNLLADPAFAAALVVGGQAVLDLVHRHLKATGLSKSALQEVVARFQASLGARETAKTGKPLKTTCPYESTAEGIVWNKATMNGPVQVPLANFGAKIIADLVEDDGVEQQRAVEIEAQKGARIVRVKVPWPRFRALDWPVEALGVEAIVAPGYGAREQLPAAIQCLSGTVPTQVTYTHTGWRKLEGIGWVYLHANGSIGTVGTVSGIRVSLSATLQRYVLPDPPDGQDLRLAIRASLGLLGMADGPVVFPLFCAIWRAALGRADFSLHLTGQTGVFKSELAALVQRHFGQGMDARNLPGSWTSTGNALEDQASRIADSIFTIDDFCPQGSQNDIQRLNAQADRIFRGAGNGSGRSRMRSDTSLRPTRPPRGLILSTGEETPAGHSLRARLLCLEIGPGDVDVALLSACQVDAQAGLYAATMAGFVQWLAARRDELVLRNKNEFPALREKAAEGLGHRRTPEIVAGLFQGFTTFLEFATGVGALEKSEADELRYECWNALGEAAATQGALQAENEPTRRFVELLSSAISSGIAYLARADEGVNRGDEPLNQLALEPENRGRRVGWTNGSDLFLDLEAALAAANEVGRSSGCQLAIQSKTLAKRLRDRGLLISTDKQRDRLAVRRMLDGQRRNVLHLSLATLYPPEPSQPSHLTQES